MFTKLIKFKKNYLAWYQAYLKDTTYHINRLIVTILYVLMYLKVYFLGAIDVSVLVFRVKMSQIS